MPEFYRYETETISDRIRLRLRKYTSFKETPCGYWVLPNWLYRNPYSEASHNRHKRWISKTSVKRHCYPTTTEAWRSFKARQRSRLRHAQRNLELAEQATRLEQEGTSRYVQPLFRVHEQEEY